MNAPPRPRAALGHALFPTTFGPCALAWSDRGLVWFQLPESSEEQTRARLVTSVTSSAGAAPPWVRAALAQITRYFEGANEDLSTIAVDLDALPPFHRKVYEAMRRIGRGQVFTYAELAAAAGSPQAFRAVGQAMAKNPIPVVIPCHRVVAAGGKPGGFSATGGLVTKARFLALEGASLSGQVVLAH
ncbi:MAG: methylated-DNA--[protein]-cysteine S-methyltransferase [Minicystis sp.]